MDHQTRATLSPFLFEHRSRFVSTLLQDTLTRYPYLMLFLVCFHIYFIFTLHLMLHLGLVVQCICNHRKGLLVAGAKGARIRN